LSAIPLATLLDKYLQYLTAKGSTDDTLKVRRVYLGMFLSWCHTRGLTKPSEISKTLLESYQQHLFHYRKKNGQPLAVSSQHSRLEALKVWFKWMARQNHISHDPASDLELPRLGYQLPTVLNKDEAELVLQQPNTGGPLGIRDRAMMEVFYSTGMRRIELLHLKIQDVDRKLGVVMIRQGKGKRDRVVPVGERALAWLETYLNQARPRIAAEPGDGTVFLTSRGEPFSPNHLTFQVRRYVRAARTGKTGACHLFRHTMATLMLEGGADIRFIQQMLGHARLDTTQIYTHVSIRMLKQVHAATHPAALLGGSMPLPRTQNLDILHRLKTIESLPAARQAVVFKAIDAFVRALKE
jgi:integrase/recombinase XerD